MRIPAVVGAATIVAAIVFMKILLGGDTAGKVKAAAQEQLGSACSYHVSSLRINSSADGRRVAAVVTAWNDTGIQNVSLGDALSGAKPFASIVGDLVANGVEYYHVDYLARSFTFYSATGATAHAALSFESLPGVAADLDVAGLRAAILDSQQNGLKFRAFCVRAMNAGVQGYIAFLRGQRVVYLGRQGDQHTEWLPGARPRDA